MGLPFISGYNPSSNAQKLLWDEVRAYLNAHWDRLGRIFEALDRGPIESIMPSGGGFGRGGSAGERIKSAGRPSAHAEEI